MESWRQQGPIQRLDGQSCRCRHIIPLSHNSREPASQSFWHARVRCGGSLCARLPLICPSTVVGVLPASAIFMGVYEPIKQHVEKRVPDNRQFLAALSGGLGAGLAASIVRVPTEVVKQRMQTGGSPVQPECMNRLWLLSCCQVLGHQHCSHCDHYLACQSMELRLVVENSKDLAWSLAHFHPDHCKPALRLQGVTSPRRGVWRCCNSGQEYIEEGGCEGPVCRLRILSPQRPAL